MRQGRRSELSRTIVWLGWDGLGARDAAAAVHLTNRTWLNTGLAVGYVATGVTLALCGRSLGRRLALVGAGLGVLLQGTALLALELRFISTLTMAAG